jgi:hypothetical protein
MLEAASDEGCRRLRKSDSDTEDVVEEDANSEDETLRLGSPDTAQNFDNGRFFIY